MADVFNVSVTQLQVDAQGDNAKPLLAPLDLPFASNLS